MAAVSVRYIVNDLEAAIAFYTGRLGLFQFQVSNLKAAIPTLREAGVRFRSDLIVGIGGNQVLLEDPSGNPIELFEPVGR